MGFLAIAYQNTSEAVKSDVFSAAMQMTGDVERMVSMLYPASRDLSFDVLYPKVRHFEFRENGMLKTIYKSKKELEQEEMRSKLRALATLEIE